MRGFTPTPKKAPLFKAGMKWDIEVPFPQSPVLQNGVWGFTLVEVLVSALILSFLITAIFGVLNIGNMTYSTDLGLLDLHQQARLAMDRMIRELRQTNTKTAEGNLSIVSDSEVTFSIPPETYGSAWNGPIRYYLDTINYRIIREYPAGTEQIVANNIDNLSFSLNNNLLDIQLTCANTVQRRGLSFSLKGQVKLRNE